MASASVVVAAVVVGASNRVQDDVPFAKTTTEPHSPVSLQTPSSNASYGLVQDDPLSTGSIGMHSPRRHKLLGKQGIPAAHSSWSLMASPAWHSPRTQIPGPRHSVAKHTTPSQGSISAHTRSDEMVGGTDSSNPSAQALTLVQVSTNGSVLKVPTGQAKHTRSEIRVGPLVSV